MGLEVRQIDYKVYKWSWKCEFHANVYI